MTDAVNPTRADLLRKRRNQTSQERTTRTTPRSASTVRSQTIPQRSATPVRSQPVTQRRATAPTNTRNYRTVPVVQKARSNPRRQYYYTVGTTGAEIRLPAIPVVKFGPRLVSGLLAMLLVAALMMLLQSSTFQVSQVTVNGLLRVSGEEIAAILDMEDEAIFVFDQQKAYEQLSRAFPELSDLKISVGLPAAITVSAVERTPILTWNYEEQSLWMDSEGVIFPVRGEFEGLPLISANSEPPLLPVAAPAEEASQDAPIETLLPEETGSILGRQMDPRVMEVTLKMLAQIPAEATLIYDRYSGLGWNDPSGWSVFVGRTLENIDMKMIEYQAIVSYLGTQGVKPSAISVESIHAPFFRTEQ